MVDNNLDSPSFFGIENTMETGIGSPELIQGLMASETATSDPDDLEKIVKEVAPVIPKQEGKPKGKEIIQKVEGEEPTDQDILKNFLGDAEEEEEPVDETIPDKPEDVSQFTALSNDLFKLGVFSKDEEEENVIIKTPEEFLERFNSEKKKGAIEIVNNFIGQFGEDYQAAFDAIYVKGVSPKEYFGVYNNIASFVGLDLTSKENQISVMRQSLADQEFEPEDITSEIERLENYGDLESAATKHHKVLVKKETAKLQQMEQKAAEELQQKTVIKNQYIQNVQTILQEKLKVKEWDGIPLNPKLINELQEFLLVDGWVTPSGEKLTGFDKSILELKKPENHASKVKIALILKILEKDPTLSTIKRSEVTKHTDNLFADLAKQKTIDKTVKKQPGNNSWFSQ